MGAWWAAYWDPADLPVLRLLIRVFDLAERGQANGAMRSELRQLLDGYGVTPKGRQDRRWLPPKADPEPRPTLTDNPYAHLRVVETGDA